MPLGEGLQGTLPPLAGPKSQVGQGTQVLAWWGSGPHSTKPGPLLASHFLGDDPQSRPAETIWRASARATQQGWLQASCPSQGSDLPGP